MSKVEGCPCCKRRLKGRKAAKAVRLFLAEKVKLDQLIAQLLNLNRQLSVRAGLLPGKFLEQQPRSSSREVVWDSKVPDYTAAEKSREAMLKRDLSRARQREYSRVYYQAHKQAMNERRRRNRARQLARANGVEDRANGH